MDDGYLEAIQQTSHDDHLNERPQTNLPRAPNNQQENVRIRERYMNRSDPPCTTVPDQHVVYHIYDSKINIYHGTTEIPAPDYDQASDESPAHLNDDDGNYERLRVF